MTKDEKSLPKTADDTVEYQEGSSSEEPFVVEMEGRKVAVRTVREACIIRQSPYPPPAEMAEYEKIHPGASERIFARTEKEQDHRHAMDRAEVQDSKRGMYLGFTIAMTAIICGAMAILSGYTISGSLLAGGSLATVVGLFVYGRKGNDKESPENETPGLPKPPKGMGEEDGEGN